MVTIIQRGGRQKILKKKKDIREESKKLSEKFAKERFESEQVKRKTEMEADKRSLIARGLMKSPEEKAKEEAGQAFLEEVGFAEEKLPEAVELEEERKGVEKLPIIGPTIKAGRGVSGREENIFASYYNNVFHPKEKVSQALLQNPETARELVLQEIQKKEAKKSTSGSEKFGAYIESIPLLGPLAGKWAGEMLETPSANVDTVLRNIKESRGRILKKYEAIRANLFDPVLGYQNILDEEENLYLLEQRIKNLAVESAILIADADKLNVIEGKILRAKEVAFFAKQAAAIQIRGEPTDASIEAWLASETKAIGEEEE